MKFNDAKNLERVCIESFAKFRQVKESGPLVVGDQQFNDIVQKFISFKTNDQIFDNAIKPVILHNLYEAEGRAAGAAEIFLHLLDVNYSQEKRRFIDSINFSIFLESLKKISKIKPTKKEAVKIIEKIEDESLRNIIQDVWNNMHRDEQIDVRRTFSDKTRVNRDLGYNFTDIKVDQIYTKEKIWSKRDVSVILIDGTIERSSHVEMILQTSHQKKESFVVFCRDATEEVRAAFLNNFMRKTTDAILVTLPYSEKTAHAFTDLKIITQADVISPELGDVITAQIYKKSKHIDQIQIHKSSINLYNKETHELTQNHKNSLQNQLQNTTDETVKDLLRKRIKSLSGHNTVIHICDDLVLRNRSCVEKTDKTFRMLRDVFSFGILTSETINLIPEIEVIKLNAMLPISTMSLKIGLEQFLSFNEVMKNMGFIILDE